jgi:predicted methyltransferase
MMPIKNNRLINVANIKKRLIALSLVSLISACGNTQTSNNNDFPLSIQNIERSERDKARDAGRKPEKVMDFFDIQSGMSVLEVLSSGGYYTELLSNRVGKQGIVYAHNNRFILDVFDGRFAKEFERRTQEDRLENVNHYIKEFGDFDLKEQIDAVTIVLNYHDMYSNFDTQKRRKVLSQIKTALKPGGTLGIIDMEAGKGEHNPKLHRIHHQIVRDELAQAGFILEAEARFLKNSTDDYSKDVFDPSVRGKTDRFVFKYIKPQA